MKLCCIGYITKDKIVTPKSTVDLPGGTAWYFSKAIKQFSTTDYQLVTSVEEAQMPMVEELRQDGIEVIKLPTEKSVCFENIYGSNPNHRTQRVSAMADPFNIDALQNIHADVIHLGSLLHEDFSLEVIKFLSEKCILSIDVQGFLRKVSPEGAVYHLDWDEKLQALPYIHTLKANEMEMEVLTHTSDPYEAALLLKDMGVEEVVLTFGDQGSLIYSKGEFHEIPAYPTLSVIDPTGCGDTYMAGYLYQRGKGATIEEAGRFAAAMCTIKLQAHGPFNSSEKVVRKIMSSNQLSKLPL